MTGRYVPLPDGDPQGACHQGAKVPVPKADKHQGRGDLSNPYQTRRRGPWATLGAHPVLLEIQSAGGAGETTK